MVLLRYVTCVTIAYYVLRGRRNTFKIFQGVSQFASRFFVAGAALCGAASSIFGAGAELFHVARVLLSRIAVSGLPQTLKVVAAARRKSLIFSFKVSGGLAQKPSFWRFKLSSWEVILAFCVARTIF